MTGYGLVNLKDMIQELGEGRTKEILSEFSCPLNKDVEFFLHCKAILQRQTSAGGIFYTVKQSARNSTQEH